LEDFVSAVLNVVEAIAYGPIRVTIDTRHRALIDFIRVTDHEPLGIIWVRALLSSPNSRNVHDISNDAGSVEAIVSATALNGFIVSFTGYRITLDKIFQFSTRVATTYGVGYDSSVSLLGLGSTRNTAFLSPVTPFAHFTRDRATLSLSVITLTVFATILRSSVN